MDQNRHAALAAALAERILILDGAMGSILHARCSIADFGGAGFDNCSENVLLHRPEVVAEIHRSYLEAGADIITTNTFGATRLVLDDFHIGDRVGDINRAAAVMARRVAHEMSTPDRPRFVAGSMGPTTKSLSVTGGVTFEELAANYGEQAEHLVAGGVDFLLIETAMDTGNVKAALVGIERLEQRLGRTLPVMISGTIYEWGGMLAGQAVDAFYASVSHRDLLAIGLNCATGPEFMTDHLRTLHEIASTRVSCYPNAGLPNAEGHYDETPESLAAQLERFIDHGWLNIVGGCCGTTPEHIRALAQVVAGRPPRAVPARRPRSWYAGVDLVEVDDSNRPLIVGERTNVIGSRAFKNLIAGEKWEEATEIARRQVRNGAHIIDVCLQSTDRDELQDIPPFYEKLIRKIKAPVMIDTTDPKAIELALTYCQGKSLINSINLEDGEEKFERVCPIARAFGAALVVGTIDEDKTQAQAFTRERKLEVARRSVDLLTAKYGIPAEDIVIDPLVFPCATGDENYIGGAVETVEALRLIKAHIPHVRTVLGISNISFGLPAAAREVVNSVFLYHCTKAGLDLAIVNAEKIERFAAIPPAERALAENLLFNTPPAGFDAPADWREQSPEQRAAINSHHIAAIAEHFRGASARERAGGADLPLDQRLANYIVQGSTQGLIEDLDRKRAEGAGPLEIINGPLMRGMDEVGRLFNNNELIVAEVLQSAEAMKTAVAHLEQFMEKAETATRGVVMLATVKGDVHDIGKNLVEIIFSNNGYRVINLGIKVPPDVLVRACQEHRPDAVGLSGLLVKSAQQMVVTAGDLREAGIDVPLLVGGAALSEKFTVRRIGPAYGAPTFYAKDAMTGLRLMNEISDPERREPCLGAHIYTEAGEWAEAETDPFVAPGTERSNKVRLDIPVPRAPYLDRHVREIRDHDEIWRYINPFMLYGRHMGYKGNFEKNLAAREEKALDLHRRMEEVKDHARAFMHIRAVWQFFEAERDGNAVHLFAPGAAQPVHTFRFGRQPRANGLCLSDYVLQPENGRRDHLALFVCTAGEGIRERTEAAKRAGRFFESHALQALAIETAEGCAEWLHRRIREDWGFPDPPGTTMQQRFTSHYRGKRYSFGYPACPSLDDQQGIWKLLQPQEIGVELTEGMMMEPEASVSALVFHHPDCSYFTASDAGVEAAAGD